VINMGVAAGTYAVRNGIADVAMLPLRADELPDSDDVVVIEGFSHRDKAGADAAAYNFIILRNRIDSDRIRTFLSVLDSFPGRVS